MSVARSATLLESVADFLRKALIELCGLCESSPKNIRHCSHEFVKSFATGFCGVELNRHAESIFLKTDSFFSRSRNVSAERFSSSEHEIKIRLNNKKKCRRIAVCEWQMYARNAEKM